MSQVLTRTTDRVREAWGMIERAEPGDTIAVLVALDYVMDGGCSRDEAKLELYRHVCRLVTESASRTGNYHYQIAATHLTLYLYDGHVRDSKGYMRGYGSDGEWKPVVKRWVKLCSWVEGVE